MENENDAAPEGAVWAPSGVSPTPYDRSSLDAFDGHFLNPLPLSPTLGFGKI